MEKKAKNNNNQNIPNRPQQRNYQQQQPDPRQRNYQQQAVSQKWSYQQQPALQQMRLVKENWFIWLMLLFFPPIGIFLIWKNKDFSKTIRILLSISGFIWLFSGLSLISSLTPSKIALNKSQAENTYLMQQIEDMKIEISNNELLQQEKDIEIEEAKRLILDENEKLKTEKAFLEDENEKWIIEKTFLEDEINTQNKNIEKLNAEIFALEAIKKNEVDSPVKKAIDPPSEVKSTAPKSNESSESSKKEKPDATLVYWTENGKSYHFSKNCVTLKRSKIIHSGTLEESKKYDPCNVCAGGK